MKAELNGIQVVYTGEGEGPPMVFLHGFPLNRNMWSKQVEAFQANHCVIAPDLRGQGESGGTEGSIPMTLFAEDLHALVQHLHLGPIVLVGHSMGGYVALAFAKAHPEALRGLVLVSTKAGADFPEMADERRALAEQVRKEGTSELVASLAPRMISAKNTDAGMAMAVRNFMTPTKPEGVIGALLGMAERPDAEAWLGDIRVPTLVITGLDDIIIPPHESEALTSAIPGAELKLISRAGHLVPFERPDIFNEALEKWLP